MRRRQAGFTLLEICLAIMIALVILGLAVPTVRGIFSSQKLRVTFEEFDDVVREAQARSVRLQCDHALVWGADGAVTLMARGGLESGREEASEAAPLQWMPDSGQSVALTRPAALEKKPAVEWAFWRSGICEPAVVAFEGPQGSWTAQYDPLTVRGTLLEEVVR